MRDLYTDAAAVGLATFLGVTLAFAVGLAMFLGVTLAFTADTWWMLLAGWSWFGLAGAAVGVWATGAVRPAKKE